MSELFPEQNPHEAGYCGMAAIMLASVLLLMALPALQLAYILQITNFQGWSASDKKMAAYGGCIGAGLIEVFCYLGVAIAARGINVSRRTAESKAPCVVAIVLSLFASALWFACGLAWYETTWRFVERG
ncbi:MAG: hypothetical protein K8T89_19645 [Planctomycetes bacterium]|nr:hypothetical protein [Planctomycetota bacterium]